MSGARHVMILASAGSGKTYALTNRFVRLLAGGARPERIVALTFTRKAAGEFFDEILHKLAEAARDPAAAARLARDTGHPRLGRADFLRMLRGLTDALHRLRLGTIDSFFARIARVFPLELGLAGDFEILEEHAARLERQRVLRRMFARAGELGAAQKEFVEAFKRATFGRDEKRLGAQLDAFLDAYQENFLAAPEGERWGNPQRIWPEGCAWLGGAAPDWRAAVQAVRAWLAAADLGDKQRGRWADFLAALETWAPGVPPPRALAYVAEKILAAWPEINAGNAVLEFDRKKQELDATACAALRDIARHVVGGELARRVETTRGLHAVLRGYEEHYHDAVRRAGKLTFADVQRLLQPGGSARALSGDADDAGRLFIDYRLDGGTDHWLLDEFQDTSFGQWSVLKNLIDEAVQDEDGTRSFFCVGDVKQAIFTWREGDPRLFREIFNHYNAAAPGTIAEEHLVRSWRSGPAPIEMVNAVFGDAAAMRALFPGAAAAAWEREWRAHESAVPERTGQAALLHAADEEARHALLRDLLRETSPLAHGLSCAVLVQKNSTATELADFLRREGWPAVAEADLHVATDNPLGRALLALVQAAAHPGDTLAGELLRMTPLGALLAAEGLATPEAVTEHVLAQIHAGGFERMADFWGRKLEPHLAVGDAFSRERARQFAAAASRFDATGSRDAAEFAQFMARHTGRDTESAGVIRVMTIHKAKGLGFDVVLLPDLQGDKLDSRRDGLAVCRNSDRSVEWVLDLPPKMFWQQDAVLAAQVAAEEAEAGYEAFSLLYVAMTRAKRAMYAITEPAGKSVSRNFPKLLEATLGAEARPLRVGGLEVAGVWAAGDADWHTKLAAPAMPPPRLAEIVPPEARRTARAPRRLAKRPSGEKHGVIGAAQIFSLAGGAAAAYGSAVHGLLAEVEWAGPAEIAARAAAWAPRGAAGEEALACLRAAELAEIFTPPPAGRTEVWRERAFEVVLDGAWVTGIFDRVLVRRGAEGRPERVLVVDFKTDRIEAGAGVGAVQARYAAQLELYRRAAAVLAGVPVARVSCVLVLTKLRQCCALPSAS
ncbi:MAG: UvrD-helicase domain-containing protein [Opitutae bacterium]|nr:UvrD-helicase domain-containing protein [Opitutae bacterium]